MLASRGWVSAFTLMKVGGSMAWRTRLSEARRRFQFDTENRQRTVRDGAKVWRMSEYRRVG
jgi:hypothetical protein